MFSGRTLRFTIIPLCATVFLVVGYFRDVIVGSRGPVQPGTPTIPYHTRPPISPFTEYETDGFPLHRFRDDGILEVNPNGPHPIFQLIDRANVRWKAKLDGASTTLEESVLQYRRRYKRAPPKGFDAWWHYVERHNIQLPDEYDQIAKDLEPFWGIDPVEIRFLQTRQEAQTDTFTLGKNETSGILLLNVSFSDPLNWVQKNLLRGVDDLVDLLQDVQHHLPPFRAVFSPHDNPTILFNYEVKAAALDAAARRIYTNLSATIKPNEQLGWLSACAPSSPARQTKNVSSFPPVKSFIHDHRLTMDPCIHPHLFEIHGQFLSQQPASKNLMVPQFAYCSTTVHQDIQAPALLSWVEDIIPRSDDPAWEHKLDERLSWRGSNTGMWHAPETDWQSAQRARLVRFAEEMNGTVKVLIPPVSRAERAGESVEVSKSKINPAMLDIAFAGAPLGCPPDFCEELSHMFEWRRHQSQKEAGGFKYVVDVDGNAWSSRFKRLLTSNSLIFKATIYPEWFLDRIEPWVHYIPVQVDFSDLYDALAFFRGGMYGEGAHEDLARNIASAGRTWSKNFWRKEDLTAYIFRLLLEYARVMSLDRDSMSYGD